MYSEKECFMVIDFLREVMDFNFDKIKEKKNYGIALQELVKLKRKARKLWNDIQGLPF